MGIIKQEISEMYERFIKRVSEGRHLSEEKVKELAEGKVLTGKQAFESKLIDELGGLSKAIQIAREKAGINERVPVSLITIPSFWRQSPLNDIVEILFPSPFLAKKPLLIKEFSESFFLLNFFSTHSNLYLMPFSLRIK